MLLFDANMLVYAANKDSSFHLPCSQWRGDARRDPSPTCLTWCVYYELLRVTTHRQVFRSAGSSAQAHRFFQFGGIARMYDLGQPRSRSPDHYSDRPSLTLKGMLCSVLAHLGSPLFRRDSVIGRGGSDQVSNHDDSSRSATRGHWWLASGPAVGRCQPRVGIGSLPACDPRGVQVGAFKGRCVARHAASRHSRCIDPRWTKARSRAGWSTCCLHGNR